MNKSNISLPEINIDKNSSSRIDRMVKLVKNEAQDSADQIREKTEAQYRITINSLFTQHK